MQARSSHGRRCPRGLPRRVAGLVWTNKPLIRALEHRRADAYYANAASQFWISELSRRLAVTVPDDDADYRALTVVTNLRADVLDYLETRQRMSRKRIRQGIHALAQPGCAGR
jgi:hypothetical protein